jgi:hypothetical protein
VAVWQFFIIKPTRCTNFTNFILAWNPTCFGQFVHPSSGVYSLYTQQWYISYRFVDSFWAGPGWNKPVWHIPLLSVQWINSWWWTDELSEKCRDSCQNKFVKLVHLVGFIIKKFVTMHSYKNVKLTCFRYWDYILFEHKHQSGFCSCTKFHNHNLWPTTVIQFPFLQCTQTHFALHSTVHVILMKCQTTALNHFTFCWPYIM